MIKFGTGGWRAIIADGFTKENIRLLTAGLCALMEKEGHAGAEICVGYDRRFLSKESAHWACEVLAGYGFRPYVINRSSPTPLIMFTVKRRNMPYGMAVTASHNPAIYNGIKVFTEGGRDADAEVTRRIEAEIEKLSPADVKSVDYDTALAEGKIVEGNPMNEYLDSILSAVNVEAIKKASLRIGFDPMYGARPLKRYVQKTVETLAAKLILKGDINTGDDIVIDVVNGELTARAEGRKAIEEK